MSKEVHQPRGGEPVSSAKLRSRKRSHDWRQVQIDKGLCPKHGKPFSRLERCHGCLTWSPDDSTHITSSDKPLPKAGEKLDFCIKCDRCEKLYHEGSYYFGENPARRRWVEEHPSGIVEGPQGSLLDYRDTIHSHSGTYVMSLCGECREQSRDDWQYRRLSRWEGLCRPCARMKRGNVPHDSGALLHYSERVLEPGGRKRPLKIKFTCANRESEPHRGEVFVSVAERDGWEGLCPDCRSRRANPNKITDEKDVEGAILRFQHEDGHGLVPVFFKDCLHELSLPREKVLRYLYEPPKLGRCPNCKDKDAYRKRIAELALMAAGSNGNGQKNVTPKKAGPDKGFNAIITERSIRDALKILGPFAPQEKLAERIGVDARSLREWQRDHNLSYKQLRQQFTETGGS
jgi:hypothetical protein